MFFQFLGNRKSPLAKRSSGENRPDNISVDIGQTEVSSGMPVGEPFVINAKQVQDGRLKIMNSDEILGDIETNLIAGAVNQPHRWRREPCRL